MQKDEAEGREAEQGLLEFVMLMYIIYIFISKYLYINIIFLKKQMEEMLSRLTLGL